MTLDPRNRDVLSVNTDLENVNYLNFNVIGQSMTF